MSIGIDYIDNIEEVLESGKVIILTTLGEDPLSVKAIKIEEDKYRLVSANDLSPIFVFEDKEEVIFDDMEELIDILKMFEFEDIEVEGE